MSFTKNRVAVDVDIYVYSKKQKEALFDILPDSYEAPVYVRHTNKLIQYKVHFNYYINYLAFLNQAKSLYPEYKFTWYTRK